MKLKLDAENKTMHNTSNVIRTTVDTIVEEIPIADMHTHIYPPSFGSLLLWGIDELLTYHYLIAEVMQAAPLPVETLWKLTRREQADYVWEHLFVRRSPISEACRGVLTCMQSLGFDAAKRNLKEARLYFSEQNIDEYIETVFRKANVSYAVMTNDPFDGAERNVWKTNYDEHPRFKAALRIDPLLSNWETASNLLREQGFEAGPSLTDSALTVVRRFLDAWADRMNPLYLAVSLHPNFRYPDDTPRTRIIDSCILPFAQDRDIPFALMIGVKKLINPGLKLAGDGVGKTDLSNVENLCLQHPANRFLVTLLSRENQHELCVLARKFPNLMPFGCWWFLNVPSIIEEITRERMEMLGLSFIPQHSDARVLDQLLYKWPHSRRIIANVLCDKYEDLMRTGWTVSVEDIRRDVMRLFSKNFESFLSADF